MNGPGVGAERRILAREVVWQEWKGNTTTLQAGERKMEIYFRLCLKAFSGRLSAI